MDINKEIISHWFKELQTDICVGLEEMDGGQRFISDNWIREEGGGGESRVIKDGKVFEKGGVNFSAVNGPLPDTIAKALKVESGNEFYAAGISIVIHPENPNVPIIHMNTRYFELSNGMYWFGGGIDMTPIYVNDAHAKYFHTELKNTCDQFGSELYPKYKKWADDYFYIPHRNETRGIGGIFFDRVTEKEFGSKEKAFEFVKEVGKTFLKSYLPIVAEQKTKVYSEAQKQWQLLRRGRYVEFNLVYDKGTKFGLDTGGRIESILMSLPKHVSWEYDHQVASGSEEERTLNLLKKDINWV